MASDRLTQWLALPSQLYPASLLAGKLSGQFLWLDARIYALPKRLGLYAVGYVARLAHEKHGA